MTPDVLVMMMGEYVEILPGGASETILETTVFVPLELVVAAWPHPELKDHMALALSSPLIWVGRKWPFNINAGGAWG